MYLEISGRPTGKTTRLITAAAYRAIDVYLSGENSDIVISSFNATMERSAIEGISDKVFEFIWGDKYYGDDEDTTNHTKIMERVLSESSIKIMKGTNMAHAYYFYDEFDCNNKEVNIFDDGYYVTTPRRIRTLRKDFNEDDDVLTILVNRNGGEYVKHTSGFDYAGSNYTKEQFETEYLGNWNNLGP